MAMTDKEFKELRERLLMNKDRTEKVVDEFLKERNKIHIQATNVPAGEHRLLGLLAYLKDEYLFEIMNELIEEIYEWKDDVFVLVKVKDVWAELRRWPVTTFVLREGSIEELMINHYVLKFNVKKDTNACFFDS